MSTDDGPGVQSRAARLEEAIRRKRAGSRRSRELPTRDRALPALLGPLQKSLWLAHRLDPDGATYHLVDAFRVAAPLDFGRLDTAFREVVARHRLLRSTFQKTEIGVEQVVDAVPLSLFVVEATEVEVEGSAREAAVLQARRPFSLERGPLVRLLLVGDLLVLTLHHILADELSLGLLWRDLVAAYEGRPLPPAHLQYDDYVAWSLDRGERRRTEIEFWRARLTPVPEPLQLPLVRRQVEPGEGRWIERQLAETASRDLRQFVAAVGATPFLLAAFAYRVLLGRLSDGPGPAIGTPVSTRNHPAVAEMVGYFTNPLVLPGAVDEDSTVEDALRAFVAETRERLAHSQTPFTDLVETLQLPRSSDRSPLFQTLFVYQQPEAAIRLEGEPLRPVVLDLGVSKFDLTLFVAEREGRFDLAVEYRTALYDVVGMQRLLALYETLLIDLVSGDRRRPVAALSLVPPEESARLRGLERGHELAPGPTTVLAQFLRQVATGGGREAVRSRSQSLDYRELLVAADEVAAALEGVSVEVGDRVGLYLDRSAAAIAAVLGCHLAATAYVPLDPRYPMSRNHRILEDAGVVVVLTSGALAGELPDGDWKVLAFDERLSLGLPDREPVAAVRSREPAPADLAYLLYTSGSSGRPKGVAVSHENLERSNAARLAYYGTRGVAPARFLLIPSLAFDSSVAGLFWMLASGGTLVLPTAEEARDPRALLELIAREGVDSLLCVPSLYSQMLRGSRTEAKATLSTLRTVIVAGEACPWSLVAEHQNRCPGVRLFDEYGPTEATVWASVSELTAIDRSDFGSQEPVPIGGPIPGVTIELVDNRSRIVPIGVPGRALIGGTTVARGYWNRPDLTAGSFLGRDADRRYDTGDRMAWTEDGQLLFLGRVDEQIKLRGVRIEPGEIEANALEWPEVRAAAAVVAGPAGGAERLTLFVAGPVPEDWRRRMGERLPQEMRPHAATSLSSLPLLPNGKIDRSALRELARLARDERPERPGAPREVPNDEQLSLRSLWQGLLGLETVGLDDNFFELGGHSLLVAEMTMAIEEDFGVRLAAQQVFQNPTVRQLAEFLAGRGERRGYEHLFPLQPIGSEAPFIVAIPHFFADLFADLFRGQRPVYGLRGVSLRVEGNLSRWPTLGDLAEEVADEICDRFEVDTRPRSGRGVYLAGYSFGASMAAETAHVLERRGVVVRGVYLVTPMALDHLSWGPLRLKIRGLKQPLESLGRAELVRRFLVDHNPLTLRPYRYAWRWLKTQPRRRLLGRLGRLRRRLGLPLTPSILHADVRADRFRMHQRFRPRHVEAPTVIFNAEFNALEPGTDAAATWRSCFQGDLEVVTIPDPHLDEGSVVRARELLREYLTRLEASA